METSMLDLLTPEIILAGIATVGGVGLTAIILMFMSFRFLKAVIDGLSEDNSKDRATFQKAIKDLVSVVSKVDKRLAIQEVLITASKEVK
tara:strand:+ start:1825 stop:2094 length:270 start_codon:yes stop_codon:yes gene_type:complete